MPIVSMGDGIDSIKSFSIASNQVKLLRNLYALRARVTTIPKQQNISNYKLDESN